MNTARPTNKLLAELARSDRIAFGELLEQMEPFALQRDAVLGTPQAFCDSVYFVESGIVALVAATRNGNSVEVGLVGKEGVTGGRECAGRPAAAIRFARPASRISVPRAQESDS